MKRIMFAALLGALLVVVGCSTDEKHNFFKPEVSGAVYAVQVETGDPTSDDVRSKSNEIVKLPMPNPCYFSPEGWQCAGDDGVIQLSDNAGDYNAAPKFKPIGIP